MRRLVSCFSRGPSAAFTLIELLIVVAIIAILAAIAVPNFLEAQVRAKVSRSKADMRSMVTAIEAYCVDYNKYPDLPDTQVAALVPPARIGIAYSRVALPLISTPVAYMTNGLLSDPFAVGSTSTTFFGYANARSIAAESGAAAGQASLANVGAAGYLSAGDLGVLGENGYVLQSVGPDRVNFALAAPPTTVKAALDDLVRTSPTHLGDRTFYYDSTNGTTSGGDIVRSAKYQN